LPAQSGVHGASGQVALHDPPHPFGAPPHLFVQSGVHPQTPGLPPPPQVNGVLGSHVPHEPLHPSVPQFLPEQSGVQLDTH
jgi:hypothetical protein